jgi:hypothetical protein
MEKVHRLRTQLSMTVHPDTVGRFKQVCDHYQLPRGQVVDKLVASLSLMLDSGRVTCCTGQPCRIDRQDVPKVL